MTNTSKKSAHMVWTDSLSFLDLPSVLGIYFRYGSLRIILNSQSGNSSKILKILVKIKIATSDSQVLHSKKSAFRLDDPDSLFLETQLIIEEFLCAFSLTQKMTLCSLRYPVSRGDARRGTSYAIAMAATHIEKLMYLVGCARFWIKQSGCPCNRYTILSYHAVLSKPFFSSRFDNEIEFRTPWNWRNSFFSHLVLTILVFVQDITRRKVPSFQRPPSVAVAHHIGIEKTSRVDELHWWWDSSIPAERMILFFDRQDIPADRSVVSEAQQLGILCVALKRNSTGNCPEILWPRSRPPFITSMRRLGRKIRMLMKGTLYGRVGRWMACQAVQTLYRSERLEDFLKQYNVRGVVHYQVGGPDWISLGCEAADSVRFGEERSHTHWPSPTLMGSHHVYFIWGEYDVRPLMKSHCIVDRYVLTGCVLRNSHPGHSVSADVSEARSRLVHNGAKRILAIFDSSVPCDGFYSFFLSRILQDQRWGLLIKPKWQETLPWVENKETELSRLFHRVQSTHRVIVLDPKESPGAAAGGADFSVGVDINTATVVAALAGHRAIHLDYLRLHESGFKEWAHFYEAGPDKIVFSDPEKLWVSLNQYYDSPETQSGLGVTPPLLLNKVDPFRDGLASRRMGEYICEYLDSLDKRMSRNDALINADAAYTSKWGENKVWKPASVGLS